MCCCEHTRMVLAKCVCPDATGLSQHWHIVLHWTFEMRKKTSALDILCVLWFVLNKQEVLFSINGLLSYFSIEPVVTHTKKYFYLWPFAFFIERARERESKEQQRVKKEILWVTGHLSSLFNLESRPFNVIQMTRPMTLGFPRDRARGHFLNQFSEGGVW